jgi:endogenous inhibitor of DNA gyrase (YacG/DUF329 family)
MKQAHCPVCQKAFDLAASPTPPFCSERCRSIDLNRWLREEIALPVRDRNEEGDITEDTPDDKR